MEENINENDAQFKSPLEAGCHQPQDNCMLLTTSPSAPKFQDMVPCIAKSLDDFYYKFILNDFMIDPMWSCGSGNPVYEKGTLNNPPIPEVEELMQSSASSSTMEKEHDILHNTLPMEQLFPDIISQMCSTSRSADVSGVFGHIASQETVCSNVAIIDDKDGGLDVESSPATENTEDTAILFPDIIPQMCSTSRSADVSGVFGHIASQETVCSNVAIIDGGLDMESSPATENTEDTAIDGGILDMESSPATENTEDTAIDGGLDMESSPATENTEDTAIVSLPKHISTVVESIY
ncbi:uncharacterized protein LOC114541022 [Dendronephthya gigantea]|uniref:uncharacterized protein LOC114541022 n=1 Tax=Dendronephthya gigantea TaxID=151771 RepID=UPI00106A6717|nr:uncharacterized protein LOC114541022 [Dendronephthya gigantea]